VDAGLSWLDIGAMFGAMALLAAVPSVSVAAVVARAASAGFVHGALVALGIVVGDILFILAAIFGLILLAEALGDVFAWVRLLGGAYLLWLAVTLLRSRAAPQPQDRANSNGLLSSFAVGLMITLVDQKAILFYLGFFPAFVDLQRIAAADVALIIAVTIVAVGGVKLLYAWAAQRAAVLAGGRAGFALQRAAGVALLAIGLWLIAGTQPL
jgi:threonine/homoserine/homoserine lactone efflux protein